jgi:hypothetical protein
MFSTSVNPACNYSAHNAFKVPRMSRTTADLTAIRRALAWSEARGWSQTDLARELRVSAQVMTNWKTRGLPPAMHLPVARLLGRSVEELVEKKAAPVRPLVARQDAAAYIPSPTVGFLAPMSLEDACRRMQTAVLAVPEAQRLATAAQLVALLANPTVSPGAIAKTLERAIGAGKRRQA